MIKTLNILNNNTWHDKHEATLSMSDRTADSVANGMRLWHIIILQSVFVIICMTLNVVGIVAHLDVYPFILLNLIFLRRPHMQPHQHDVAKEAKPA